MAKLPKATSNADIAAFLEKVAATPARAGGGQGGRLIFAMDATASREPTWDQACHIQAEMFTETSALGGLEVQLVYYRGFRECRASRWAGDAKALLRLMTGVTCLGGRTQIERILGHAIKETKKQAVNAVVFVGDAIEEDIDLVCHKAGELGLLGVPVFVFHEGGDPVVRGAFQQIARLSNGAYCPFDSGSARQLRDLMSAVAVYAAGGRRAMIEFGERRGGEVLQLTRQMNDKS